MPTKATAKPRGRAVARLEDWSSIVMGLGIVGQDKRKSFTPSAHTFLTSQEIENIYRGDFLGRKIVDKPAEEATKCGWMLGGIDPVAALKIEKEFRRLKFKQLCTRALKYARKTGGAGIVLIADDNERWQIRPLDTSAIRRVVAMNVLSCWQLTVQQWQEDPTQDGYGEPSIYRSSPTRGKGMNFHSSRVLRFVGPEADDNEVQNNAGWGDSIYETTFQALQNYNLSHDAIATLMADISLAVFKMKGLAAAMAGSNEASVLARLALIRKTLSVANMFLLDADSGEEYERKTTPIAGIADLANIADRQVIAASDMPHTVVFGESPSGLGATGESEENTWFGFIDSIRNDKLAPVVEQAAKIVAVYAAPGYSMDDLVIKFPSLHQKTDKEVLDEKKVQADIDNVYLGMSTTPADTAASFAKAAAAQK